jgi:hypothetical protein
MRVFTLSRFATLGVALCAIGFAGHSEAGIVVLKNGEVFVGKIRSDDVTLRSIVLHGVRGEDGQFTVPRHRVRWFDADSNVLTHEYFEHHLTDSLLGSSWVAARERWIEESNREPLPPIEIIVPDPLLEMIPSSGYGFNVRKPYGWNATVRNGILVFKAPRVLPSGFAPRIHVFSVASVNSDRADQVDWIRAELERVSGPTHFQILELNRLRQVPQGENQRLVTETHLEDRKVLAVREVLFRNGRTYFFAGYADARDFSGLRDLLELSLDSLSLSAD